MKKLQTWATMAVIVATTLLAGCKTAYTPGNTMKGITPSPEGAELASNECIDLAEQSPATRAWGNAQHFNMSDAVALAEADARGKMANAIASAVKNAVKRSGFDISQYASTDTEGHTVTDGGEQQNRLLQSIANETIENTTVIKTKRFILPNRKYNIYVCIEFQGGISGLSKTVMDGVQQKIPDEQKLKLQYEFKKFEDSVNEEIKKMRN